MPRKSSAAPRATRYVALARPPVIGNPWVEVIGAPGESRETVEARALQSLEALCAPYTHYGTVEVIAYSAAERAYPREMLRYAEAQAYERARTESCMQSATEDNAARDAACQLPEGEAMR